MADLFALPVRLGHRDTFWPVDPVLFRSLSMFDSDFARAFIDGRMYDGFSHEQALRSTTVPIPLMHARWMRLDAYGLVGAMDDQDVARVVELAPQTQVRTFPKVNHVIGGPARRCGSRCVDHGQKATGQTIGPG